MNNLEGDKVYLHVTATEKNGVLVFSSEIGQKPQFMLNEEYVQSLIDCAILAVKKATEAIYPDNVEMQQQVAEAIGKRAFDGHIKTCILEE